MMMMITMIIESSFSTHMIWLVDVKIIANHQFFQQLIVPK